MSDVENIGCTGNAATSLDYGVSYVERNDGDGMATGVVAESLWLNNHSGGSSRRDFRGKPARRGARGGEGEGRAIGSKSCG